ncbi:cutinase family protein [Amnibacterium flavum]|uniref:cutinase family protein n=1 Tax=Amnibacterium flavum TaxID=2173173 RepID=UPI0014030FB7|nr:cutinase family protein [Amnibacterium flavum]
MRPFTRIRSTLLPSLLAVTLVATLVGTTAPTKADAAVLPGNWSLASSAAPNQPCADVLFIGVPGSGELDDMGKTVRAVRDNFKARLDQAPNQIKVRQVYIDYQPAAVAILGFDLLGLPPAGRFAYFESIDRGAAELNKVLADSANRCKTEKWVLAGYSQGALVTNLATTYDPKFYAGIYLLGDPSQYPYRAGTTYGGAPKATATGIYDQLGRLKLNKDLRLLTYTACHARDAVCDNSGWLGLFTKMGPKKAVDTGLAAHTNYATKPNEIYPTTTAIVQRLLKINKPRPTPPVENGVISDPALADCIKQALQVIGVATANPTATEVAQLANLSCTHDQIGQPNFDVASLEGLQHATNLQLLTINSTKLADLTPIQNLPNLEIVEVHALITDPSPLATLPKLRRGNLSGNQIVDIRSIDVLVRSRVIIAANQVVSLPNVPVNATYPLPDIWGTSSPYSESSQLTPGLLLSGMPEGLPRNFSLKDNHFLVTWTETGLGELWWYNSDLCTQCFDFGFSGKFVQQVD